MPISEPELGKPLEDFMQRDDARIPKELADRIRLNTKRIHELASEDRWGEDKLELTKAQRPFALFGASFMRLISRDWRSMILCMMTSGRLGWVLEASLEGDCIAIVALDVPLVFRPCCDGTYKLIGEAYLHDVMDGSMVRDLTSFDSIHVT